LAVANYDCIGASQDRCSAVDKDKTLHRTVPRFSNAAFARLVESRLPIATYDARTHDSLVSRNSPPERVRRAVCERIRSHARAGYHVFDIAPCKLVLFRPIDHANLHGEW
jgi:hypothetical protein